MRPPARGCRPSFRLRPERATSGRLCCPNSAGHFRHKRHARASGFGRALGSTERRLVTLVRVAVAFPFTSTHTSQKPVNFDNQVVLSQNSLAQANPYYPVPVPSPPWIHPSPSSDSTPPTSNSPSSTLAHYAAAPMSPPPATELLPTNSVVDARAQDASEDVAEPAPQSPPATRGTQATGRRPGACSRCKKLKVRGHSSIEFSSSRR